MIDNRNYNIDLYKFMAALIIMANHIYHIGVTSHPFDDGWIFVEFFLLLTGFYTGKHYVGVLVRNKAKSSIEYLINKFLPLVPYAFITTLVAWITNGILGYINEGWNLEHFIRYYMASFVYDLLLLTSSFGRPLVEPLWYLSSLIIVFPIFVLLVQVKNRYAKMITMLLCPLLYYGWMGVVVNRDFPQDLLRTLAGLMLGAFVYELSVISKPIIEKVKPIVLTIIELLCLAVTIGSTHRNWATRQIISFRFIMLCFVVIIIISTSKCSYTDKINGPFFELLGEFSVPMFITHWYVGTLIDLFGTRFGWGDNLRIVVYYTLTLVLSVIMYLLFERIKWVKKLKKEPIILPE